MQRVPLVNSKESSVIKLIPPPPLHVIRLGPVNKLMDSLDIHCPDITKEFLSGLHVVREQYHSGNFEGMFINVSSKDCNSMKPQFIITKKYWYNLKYYSKWHYKKYKCINSY